MADRNALKAELVAAIENCQPDGTYDDEGYAHLNQLVQALLPHTPRAPPVRS